MCILNYIVFDMEWNQPISKNSYPYVKIGSQLTNEIIQIGAYKLNDKFQITDSFCRYVHPSFYKKLNRNVLKITELDKENIENGDDFIDVFEDFMTWCGKDFCFFTWGPDDISVMRQNINFYSLSPDKIKNWYNLQLIYSKEVLNNSVQCALNSAMEHFGIDVSEARHLHDALNDAYYTALIFQKLNIKDAIKNYAPPSDYKLICCGLAEKRVGLYKTKELAFQDKKVCDVNCPLCGNELVCVVPWFNNNARYNYIGKCKNHGEFLSRIRFEKNKSSLLYAFKNVKKTDADTIKRIKEKNLERTKRIDMWANSKKRRPKKHSLWKNIFRRKTP